MPSGSTYAPHEGAPPGTPVQGPASEDGGLVAPGCAFLTIAQLAQRLGVKRQTIYNWRNLGKMPIKPRPLAGGAPRYARADVEAYIRGELNKDAPGGAR